MMAPKKRTTKDLGAKQKNSEAMATPMKKRGFPKKTTAQKMTMRRWNYFLPKEKMTNSIWMWTMKKFKRYQNTNNKNKRE